MSLTASPRPQRTWQLLPQRPEIADTLRRDLNIGAVAARVLAARDMTEPKAVGDFLRSGLASMGDPMLLPDMDIAVKRIAQAMEQREQICIHGDYDVDGTTSTAVLLRTFAWLGVEGVRFEIPHRIHEGYGINPEAVDRLADDGVTLIITVDNGTGAHPALERARERGVDVIVTDHHQIGESLPPALAIVNPWREGSEYPQREICGCALAFKLAAALLKHIGKPPEKAKPFLMSLLDLVAVATVADVMPLVGENRAVVRFALGRLLETTNVGLRALMQVAKIEKVSSETIGWGLGPRLNAAGRTRHASIAVDLLMAEKKSVAANLAKELDDLNRERRDIEAGMIEEALKILPDHQSDAVIVLAKEAWHQGVLGIVASRVLDRSEKPTLMLTIADGEAHGSARSLPGFDMHAALTACSDHLLQFGGHAMAAGMKCREDALDDFRRAINDYARSLPPEALAPRPHRIDTNLESSDLTLNLFDDLATLEPHGEGNPKPKFLLKGMSLVEAPKVIKDRHVKLRLISAQGAMLTAMAWGKADRIGELIPAPERIDIIGQPRLNEWNGRRSVEFVADDWRPSDG